VSNRPLTDFDKAVAAYIRATSAAKKIGQETTAERAGIHINTFRRYWRGERAPSLGDLRTIFDALGVTLPEAMQEIERIYTSGQYDT
jgi:transcriptional regulator with XRE-family HTH domain